jgi:hypothetical protein
VHPSPFQTFVPARGCAPVRFSILANGRIEGRVVRPDGSPAVNVVVEAVPADHPPGQRLDTFMADATNEYGEFEIDAILPGRYIVAVNMRFGANIESRTQRRISRG